jgi:2-polyprenyl-3-methyl-5-hydroxy-6-metoxy-1,4-benzoquinol methylase
MKRAAEVDFWRQVLKREEGPLNPHFQTLYQGLFGLTSEFYEDKRLLDVGCGPTGSLEWATMAADRVGLDPLVP